MAIGKVYESALKMVDDEMDLGLGVDEVSPTLVRYWCEAFEDSNPVYRDREVAKTTRFGGLIAPPMLAASVCRPPDWPVEPGEHPTLGDAVAHALGHSESVVQSAAIEYFEPLRIGDRVRCIERTASLSEEKNTRLGVGHFHGLERRYSNQDDVPIMVANLSFFKYSRGEQKGQANAAAQRENVSVARSDPRLRGGYKEPKVIDPASFKDGNKLTELTIKLNPTRMIQMAYISRDFNPVHHDAEYAQANGVANMFMQWACYAGNISRYVSEELGPDSWIKKMSFKMARPLCANETMTLAGKVDNVNREKNGPPSLAVSVEISDTRGPATSAEVLVLY